jgi:hypothetical protein
MDRRRVGIAAAILGLSGALFGAAFAVANPLTVHSSLEPGIAAAQVGGGQILVTETEPVCQQCGPNCACPDSCPCHQGKACDEGCKCAAACACHASHAGAASCVCPMACPCHQGKPCGDACGCPADCGCKTGAPADGKCGCRKEASTAQR